jgi:hypothetical protein
VRTFTKILLCCRNSDNRWESPADRRERSRGCGHCKRKVDKAKAGDHLETGVSARNETGAESLNPFTVIPSASEEDWCASLLDKRTLAHLLKIPAAVRHERVVKKVEMAWQASQLPDLGGVVCKRAKRAHGDPRSPVSVHPKMESEER